MGTRIGTDYAHRAEPIDTYQALKGDDIIMPLIATGKTITLPAISSLGPDDKEKIIGNQSGSAGNATYAAASGDAIEGLAVFLPGQNARITALGRKWESFGGVVDSGTGTTATSVADSKAVSAASMATSQNLSQSANESTGRSVAGSATLSGVSATASVATSQNTSQSANLSLTTSKADSG